MWFWLVLQIPAGIIAGTWIKRRAEQYFDRIEDWHQ